MHKFIFILFLLFTETTLAQEDAVRMVKLVAVGDMMMGVHKNRLIAYNLGNFLTYKRLSMKGVTGESPILELEITEEGGFLNGKIYSYRQGYDHLGSKPDVQNGATLSMKKLAEEEFPNSSIFIDGFGRITYFDNTK